MGGPSQEHAISLKSGRGVVEALRAQGFNVEPVEVPHELTTDSACGWTRDILLALNPDVVFIALHGTFGEDGAVQQVCEDLNLPYVGSDVQASRLGMDKLASRKRFQEAGLDVPRSCAVRADSPDLSAVEALAFPLVVKPIDQGSSVGVTLVRKPDELQPAITEAGRFSAKVLVDEFVRGRELTVGVLGSRALPVVEVIPKAGFFDFASKYTVGMTEYKVPAVLDPETAARVQAIGWRAHQAIGCRHLSRTDLILTPDGRGVILEVNTIPGFTPTSLLPKAAACVGLSYDALCRQLVEMAAGGARHSMKTKA